jgi:hypothetical protein
VGGRGEKTGVRDQPVKNIEVSSSQRGEARSFLLKQGWLPDGLEGWMAGGCRGNARQSPGSALGAVQVWSCDEQIASLPPTVHGGFVPGNDIFLRTRMGFRMGKKIT